MINIGLQTKKTFSTVSTACIGTIHSKPTYLLHGIMVTQLLSVTPNLHLRDFNIVQYIATKQGFVKTKQTLA